MNPIGYLEIQDFDQSGNLKTEQVINPNAQFDGVFVMIQRSDCPACVQSKPSFEELAKLGVITCMTIQLDGEKASERQIGSLLDKIYPNMLGVPSFVLYKNNTKIPYEGPRTLKSMTSFLKTVLL